MSLTVNQESLKEPTVCPEQFGIFRRKPTEARSSFGSGYSQESLPKKNNSFLHLTMIVKVLESYVLKFKIVSKYLISNTRKYFRIKKGVDVLLLGDLSRICHNL